MESFKKRRKRVSRSSLSAGSSNPGSAHNSRNSSSAYIWDISRNSGNSGGLRDSKEHEESASIVYSRDSKENNDALFGGYPLDGFGSNMFGTSTGSGFGTSGTNAGGLASTSGSGIGVLPSMVQKSSPGADGRKEGDADLDDVPPFLRSLFDICSNPDYSHIIGFVPTDNPNPGKNRRVRIFNADLMVSDVLPLYFRHNKLTSFFRQLSNYSTFL